MTRYCTMKVVLFVTTCGHSSGVLANHEAKLLLGSQTMVQKTVLQKVQTSSNNGSNSSGGSCGHS